MFKSIRTQLVLLVLISIIPALGIILYSGLNTRKDAIKEAEHNALVVLHGLTVEHERVEEGTRQLLITLSQLPDVQNLDRASCDKLLGKLLIQNQIYANLLISNAKGMVVSSALPFTPYSISHRKYFRETFNTKDFSAGEYTIGGITKLPVLHFSYPILDIRGNLKGVVAAGIDLARYGDIFLKAKMPRGSILGISDHKGIRLFRYPYQDNLTGTAASPQVFARMTEGPDEGIFTRPEGSEKRLIAYKRFSLRENATPYLFMAVGISERQALAAARRGLLINLVLLGIAFLIAVASALIIGKAVIVNRLNRLVSAARKLGAGDLTARTDLPYGKDELAHLAETFDAMAGELEQKEIARKHAEEMVKTSERRYKELVDSLPQTVVELDETGTLTFVNLNAFKMFGYSREDLEQDFNVMQVIAPEDHDRARENLGKVGSGQALSGIEYRGVKKDGSMFPFMAYTTPAFSENEPVRLRSIIVDISDLKQAAEQVKASLREKEILLKEIHHRVKNNLQIISSLLNLQSRYEKNEKVRDIFSESINRVKTMANIHSLLYQSKDYARIDFTRFIRELATQMHLSYDPNKELVIIKIHVTNVLLDISMAIPCGLIINELMSNAMKYAFPSGRKGEIDITMYRENGHVLLTVSDNGVGFPETVNFRETESLGLQLVNDLVEQLDGAIELSAGTGTEFRITFKTEE